MSVAKYVVIGYSPTNAKDIVKYSVDGTNWTDSSINTAYPTCVYHNSNIWVVGGNNAGGKTSISYSADGINWNSSSNSNSIITQVNDVFFNGNCWVAVGSGINTIATSQDAKTWAASGTIQGGGKCITNRSADWYIGGIGGNAATSTATYSPSWTTWKLSINQSINGFDWNGSTMVAVGESTGVQLQYVTYIQSGIYYRGTQLITSWKSATINGNTANSSNTLSSAITGVQYGQGKFIAVGKSTTSYPIIYVSTSGLNWTPVSLPNTITPYLNKINYYDSWGIWTIVGNVSSGKCAMATSLDGINWTGSNVFNSTLSNEDYITSISPFNKIRSIYTGSRGGSNSLIYYSYNGLNWFQNKVSTIYSKTSQGTSIANNSNVWVIGTNGTLSNTNIYYSTDGITWTGATAGTATIAKVGSLTNIVSIDYGNGVFVAAGGKTPAFSTDGITWTEANSTFLYNAKCVVFRNNIFVAGTVAVSSISYVYTSNNGNTWSTGKSLQSLANGDVVGIESNGNIWVILCNSTTTTGKVQVLYSYDLSGYYAAVQNGTSTTITLNNTFGSGGPTGITYNAGRFFICGYNGGSTLILTSYDGINWIYNNVLPSSTRNCLSINYNNNIYVCGINAGTSINSYYYNSILSSDGNTWIVNTSSVESANYTGAAISRVYILSGSKPIITNIVGSAGALTITFSPSTGGDSPPTYQYSLDNSSNFTNITNLSNNTFTLSNLSNPSYTVYLQATGVGWTSAYDSSLAYLPVVGSAPAITSTYSILNGVKVYFNKPVGGNPDPIAYYYTISGDVYDGTTYTIASTTTSPITISGLNTAITYSFSLIAQNTAGNTNPSAFSKSPYIAPTTVPSITQIDSSLNKLIVSFTGPTDSYLPANPVYYYSLDGGAFINSSSSASPLVISSGLTTAKSYNVVINAVASDASGNIWTSGNSADVSGQPYIAGSIPIFQPVEPSLNSLIVSLNASTGGYPDPTNYLIATDASFANVVANLVYPNVITTISGLLNQQYTLYGKAISSNIWTTSTATSTPTTPYWAGNASITAAPISSTLNALQLTFATPVAGNPVANVFSYSLDGGNTYIANSANVVIVPNLPSSQSTIYATVGNESIWTSTSVSTTGTPYYLPSSDPSINSVDSSLNTLVIRFSAPSIEGNPTTSRYYCAVDSSSAGNFIYSGTSSPIVIPGFSTSGTRTVYLKTTGNINGTAIWTSNIVSATGQPYITGITPNIVSLTPGPGLYTLSVNLAPSAGGYPDPTNYQLSYSNTFSVLVGNLIAPNVSTTISAPLKQSYTVYSRAIGGNIWTSAYDSSSATPYYEGTTTVAAVPVSANLNTLSITLGGTDGNPARTSYSYSTDGTTFVDISSTTFQLTQLENRAYTIYANSRSGTTWTSTTANVVATPYYVGDAPTIDSVIKTQLTANTASLSVSYTVGTAGNPAATTYLYSIDGAAYVDAATTANPLIISSVSMYKHTLSIKAKSGSIWTSADSNTYIVPGYQSGSAPNIQTITSGLNSLTVAFAPSTGGVPDPTNYQYAFVDADASYSNVEVSNNSFTLSNLSAKSYTVYLRAINAGIWTSNSTSATATPYYVPAIDPSINAIDSSYHNLIVRYTGSSGGNPATSAYYYAVDSNSPESFSLASASPIIVPITTATTHTIYLKSVGNDSSGVLAWTSNIVSKTGRAYVESSPPIINQVVSELNTLVVNITDPNDGYPAPTIYYYSVDDGASFTSTGTLANTFTIASSVLSNVSVKSAYIDTSGLTVWTSNISNSVAGIPYVTGQAPTIDRLDSSFQSLIVSFTASVDQYPTASTYYYSTDGGATYTDALKNTSPIKIAGLTSPSSYTVLLKGSNLAGNTQVASASATPYYAADAPVITQIDSSFQSLIVSASPATSPNIAGNPAFTTYLYSIDSGPFYSLSTGTQSPFVIPDVLSAFPAHTVAIKTAAYDVSNNQLWISNASAVKTGSPYVVGSAPVIANVVSIAYGLTVSVIPATDMNPSPTSYLYSTDSWITYGDTGSNATTFNITGLNTAKTYYVSVKAVNSVGTTAASLVSVSGEPYIAYNAPTINSIESLVNGMRVNFTAATNGYPAPTYYYSLDGGSYNLSPNIATPLIIGGLTSAQYSVKIKAYNLAGFSPESNSYDGYPYVIGQPPVIGNIQSAVASVIVNFTDGSGGNPPPTAYIYTINGGASFLSAGQNTSPITITELTTAVYSNIAIKAINFAGTTQVSNYLQGIPYLTGTAPHIANVVSRYHSLVVNFSAPTNANPPPTTYYYSLDGGSTFTLASESASPITISGLNTAVQSNVCILAQNTAGNTQISNTVLAEPWVVGSAPQIANVVSQYQSVLVRFTDGTGGYPSPSAYYYSTGDGNYQLATDVSGSAFIIGNLTTATVYSISMFAQNSAGNTQISNTASGEPWIIGTAPHISNVVSQYQSVLVRFTDGTGGYPVPSAYYYSIGDGNYRLATDVSGSAFIIGNLTTSTVYSISMFAQNSAGNTQVSNTVSGEPWIIGSPPVISNVVSKSHSLEVYFSNGTGGYPEITQYYYALDTNATVFYPAPSGTAPPSFTITGLDNPTPYYVSLVARNAAGDTARSNTKSGTPYIISDPPVINSVASGYQSLTINFTAINNGYPVLPERYYYSLDLGNTYSLANGITSPITITGLTSSSSVVVYLVSSNAAGNTQPAISDPNTPNVIGQPPVITDVSAEINGLAVSFNPPVGGYPAPFKYLYSVDGGAYVDAGNVASPLHIPNLFIAKSYSVQLKATNVAGTTAPSDLNSRGMPFVVWGAPHIDTVVSKYNGLNVYFSASSTLGNPAPDSYYYTIDGGNTYTQAYSSDSFISIDGLSEAKAYYVGMLAHNIAGNSTISNTASGEPWVIGTAPTITEIKSATNSIEIYFADGIGGYPSPTSYLYSLDSGSTYQSATTAQSPIIVGNLTTPNTTYYVQLKAVNLAGISPASSPPITGRPWIIGTAPTISSVESGYHSLTIHLIPGEGGYPDPITHYYSLDDSSGTFFNSDQTGNTITIYGLTTPTVYNIAVKATNAAGNTGVSNTISGGPWIIGTAPNISAVDSSFQSLVVRFTPSTGGYPDPTTYYYSLNGTAGPYVNSLSTSSPIIISNLTTATVYSVALKARYAAGNTQVSNTVSGKPWIIGTAPTITQIDSSFERLVVQFAAGTGGFPDPPTYYYSLNGAEGPFIETDKTSSPLIIGNLKTATEYSIAIFGQNSAGNTQVSNTVSGEPWIIGTSPTITQIDSSFERLVVYFTAGTGGYPAPTKYYYSLNGTSGPFVDSLTTSSPLIIGNLKTATVYSIAIKAENTAGNTQVSNTVSGEPWIIGTAPTITQIDSSFERLVVRFTAGTGGYPDPPTYYYSLNGTSGPFVNSLKTSSPLIIGNLKTATVYSIAIKGSNAAGNTLVSNTVSGEPWVIGTAPTIQSVVGASGEISISFTESTGAYPIPTYDYSLDGGNTYVSTAYTASPITVAGFIVPTVCYVSLRAVNSAGNIVSTNTVVGQPLIIGSTPTITQIDSSFERLVVKFTESTGGYPDPPVYYYSLNGAQGTEGTFIETNTTSSPLIIGNLKTATVYSIAIKAGYSAGNTQVSNTVSGEPWIIGTAPTITQIDSSFERLVIQFTAGTGGYPDPPVYYYSLNGAEGPFVNSLKTSSPLIIGNLKTATVYSIAIKGSNAAGNTQVSNTVSGEPWIIGTAPTITQIDSSFERLVVYFTAGTGGFPDPPTYYYSLNGTSGPFVNSLKTSSPLIIGNLTTATVYSIAMKGSNAAGNTQVSNTVSGEPWIIGTAPTITQIDSSFERLVVRFTAGTGGYPEPTKYYYSLGGVFGSWIDAGTTGSPIIIGNLTTATEYSIAIKAENSAGNTQVSNTVSGEPWIIGTPPTITQVDSSFERLVVKFNAGTGGYPEPTKYYYSLAGTVGPWTDAGTTSSPIIIGNLTTATEYSIAIKAENSAGNTQVSNTVSGEPWIIGTAPNISSVDSSFQSIVVRFTAGTGGYPFPDTYYYTLNGGGSFVNAGVSSSPIVISGLTTPTVYSVRILAHNSAGNTSLSAAKSGQPWVIGSAPVLIDASSTVGGLVIKFNESTGGYPTPTYWYSLDAGNTYTNSGATSSPITLTGLNTYAVYNVSVKAVSDAGNITSANTLVGKPYVVGSAPTITDVSSALNSLIISYAIAGDMYPAPSKIQYSVGGLANFVDASSAPSSGKLTVGGLALNSPYTIYVRAVNLAGTTAASGPGSGTPYLIGAAPIITDISSVFHGLRVYFTGSTGGNPAPSAYYYTTNSGITYSLASGVSSPITISGLDTATTYNVGLIANSLVGNTQLSGLRGGIPYIVGTTPVIRMVDGDVNSLIVSFDESTDGYPTPTYWYSIDGGATYTDSGATSSPFIISGLAAQQTYWVQIKAVSVAGETYVSNTASGEPIVSGTALNIYRIDSVAGGMQVYFERNSAGVPMNGTNYYYSLNGGNTFANSGQRVSPVIISGLTTSAVYQVVLRAINTSGRVALSNTVEGRPYILRTAPVIQTVVSLENGLRIEFDESTGGYPATTISYWYSLDSGATFVDSGRTSSPITVSNLTVANDYGVIVKAQNEGGLSAGSNMIVGRPYVVWKAPAVINIAAEFQTAIVEFSAASGGYPAIASYMYSLDRWNTTVNVGNLTAGPTGTLKIELANLTEGRTYFMGIRAVDLRGVFSGELSLALTTKSVGRFFQNTMNSVSNRNRPIFIGEQPVLIGLPTDINNPQETQVNRQLRIRRMNRMI